METFRTEFLENIAKRAEIKAELEQSIITFSLQKEHRAEVLAQVRACALENIETVGKSLLSQELLEVALPIFSTADGSRH